MISSFCWLLAIYRYSFRRHFISKTISGVSNLYAWHQVQTGTDHYHCICVEDLTVCNMVRNHHLAKSIMDASWSAFLTILEDKAERAGHRVVRVNPRFTTQVCNTCGALIQKSLSVRTHSCPFCGFVADRDVNAAKNILLAGARPSGMALNGEPDELRSPAQKRGVVTKTTLSQSAHHECG